MEKRQDNQESVGFTEGKRTSNLSPLSMSGATQYLKEIKERKLGKGQ